MKKLTIIITIALLSCHPAWSVHDNYLVFETGLNIKYCGHDKVIVNYEIFHLGKVKSAISSGWVLLETPVFDNFKEMVKCGKRK